MSKPFQAILFGLSILIVTSWADDTADTDDAAEPAFPSLIDSATRRRIHITSESFDAKYGYETIEEYIDLESGKATYTSSTKQGHRTTFIDSTTQTIYRYKPYTCLMLKQSELISAGETGVWTKIVKVYRTNDRDDSSLTSRAGTGEDLHLFEVAAVWMNAADMPKTYTKSSVVYSSGKDMFRPAHKWTIKDGPNQLVHLYFIDGTINSKTTDTDQQLSLEMIQEEVEGKIRRTINVLSIDYYIPTDIYETLLQVPLGYGCKPDNKSVDFVNKHQLIDASNRQKPNRLRMEVTATKFPTGPDGGKKSTDTMSIDLLVKSYDKQKESSVQMVRQRNSQKDIKVVIDYLLRVQYSIDLRRGTCSLAHATSWDSNMDKFSVDFNNGLRIGFDWPILMELFDASPNCEIIKVTDRGKAVEFVYEECQTEKIFSQRPARMMKKYSFKRGADVAGNMANVNLESVTVWVLDDKLMANSIVESYHFYIVEDDLITDRLELVRLIDISEECYLNNNAEMKYGRDYAWVELTYPLASRQLDTLAAHPHELKERIHQQFRLFFDTLMRMPRVELMFTDTGVIIRLLLLDVPGLIYMWDSYPQKGLVVSQANLDAEDTFQETTVDAKHCADLCRLHNCKAMSYCTNNYACITKVSKVKPTELDSEMKRDPSCTVYLPPTSREDNEEEDSPGIFDTSQLESLHYVLSRLQHEDLVDIQLPEMPQELLYPQSVSGLSDQELIKKQAEYLIAVYKRLDEQDKFLPTLAMMFSMDGSMLFMCPAKFELEQDPLAEFNLDTNQESLDSDSAEDNSNGGSKMPAFHEGLPLYRYKLSAFRNADEQSRWDAHQYVGLSYDQCALACTDGRCSSFSYCQHRQDCTITNIYNLEQAKKDEQIVQDTDCFIAQREFLSKFNEFPNVFRPAVYKRAQLAHNPTECAHSCIVETDFNCLAFDYCKGVGQQTSNQCYYLDTRIIYTGSNVNNKTAAPQPPSPPPLPASSPLINIRSKWPSSVVTGCSHFSRSYLAEFTRIAHREINQLQLLKLKTSIFGGHSIDKCADICLNELNDCTAFQFCFNPDAEHNKQQCTMIESRPDGEDLREFRIVQDSNGTILEQGKFFVSSVDCHVFAIRRDTSEAQMREVALEPLSPAAAKSKASHKSSTNNGMTLGGAILLYLTTTAIFAVIGCSVVLVRHHSSYVSERYDRFKALFGYY